MADIGENLFQLLLCKVHQKPLSSNQKLFLFTLQRSCHGVIVGSVHRNVMNTIIITDDLGGSGTDVVCDSREVKAIVNPSLTRHLDTACGIPAGEVCHDPI